MVGRVHVPSNGEVERPPRSVSSGTRAHNFSQRSRRAPRRLSRTAPTIVRGRHKPAYCARAEVSWQRSEGTAQRWDPQGRFRLPARALRQAKDLRLQLPALHDFQGESWLRTLTVKLRGRPEASTKRRGRTVCFSARGADTQAVHGPLQRLLGATQKLINRGTSRIQRHQDGGFAHQQVQKG